MKKKKCNYSLTVVFLLLIKLSAVGQALPDLKTLMSGYDFIGHPPSGLRWSVDGLHLCFEWNPNNELAPSTYRWKNGMTAPELLPASKGYMAVAADPAQQAQLKRYFLWKGGLFCYVTSTGTYTEVLRLGKSITDLEVSNRGKVISFVHEGNAFIFYPEQGTLRQLTNFQSGEKKSAAEKNQLQKQQEELFEIVRKDKAKQELKELRSRETGILGPKTIYTGIAYQDNVQVAPSGRFVTFRLTEEGKVPDTHVEKAVTSSGYTERITARAKVSVKGLNAHNLGIYDIERDSIYFVDFSLLSTNDKLPAYWNDSKEKYPIKGVVMNDLRWSKDGQKALCDVRSLDNKQRWIILLTLESNSFQELDVQRNEAWIGGPGIGEWDYYSGELGYLDEEVIYFQSEVTGYSHLYTYHLKTKEKKALTSGAWEVREVHFIPLQKRFFLTTSKPHPGKREIISIDLPSGALRQWTTTEGGYEAAPSPDGKQLAFRYSNRVTPWEIMLQTQAEGKWIQVTQSQKEAFKQYKWYTPEVVMFTAKDGKQIHARLYLPEKSKANGAAVIFVHGAGYLQNAHFYWSQYHREFLFHQHLREQGFTVLDIDYRASDGYGEAHRTGIYRHMGGLDLEDHLDGKNYLVKQHGIDPKRVGMYGGSYGGFITLMALLTKPGEFACGAALRAVTDWSHYNQGYTSNILNFPETDSEAYRKSSPIYFAENLQEPLLLLHGQVDDNVQVQDVIRLSQRFIELGKTTWDMTLYPIENHGFTETSSWFDEYRRIELLMKTYLVK